MDATTCSSPNIHLPFFKIEGVRASCFMDATTCSSPNIHLPFFKHNPHPRRLRGGHRLFCNESSLSPQWKQTVWHARHPRQSLFRCVRVHCSSRSSERSMQDEIVGLDSSHSQALSDVLSDGSGSFVVPEEESLALSMAACSGRYRNRFLNFVRIGTVVDDMAESFFKSEIRRRLFVTSLLIVASRVGYFIPLPGFDRRLMPQDYLSFTSGSTDELGDFTTELKLSLFQLGISPQIAASILMQIFFVGGGFARVLEFLNAPWGSVLDWVLCHILPSLVKLRKEGLDGHEKIKGYIWWASLGFAVLEAVIVAFYSLQYSIYAASQRFKHVAFTSFLLVIGAMSMTWISDTISEFGFGHGSSLIICIGILTGYTETLYKMLSHFSGNMISSWPYIFAVIGVFTVVTMWAVLVTEGCRKIKLQYYGFKLASATRNDSPVTEVEPYIPFNINPTGMQPVLTTTYLLAFPSVIASIFKSPFWENIKEILNPTNSVGAEPWIFYAIFAFFVFVFNIFDIANLPKEISDYMTKMGARIPNVKPGRATVEYLTKVQASTRFWGGVLLSILATSSSILDRYLRRVNENFSIGFTSVLIIVGSIIELRRSYQAYNVMPTLSKVLRRYGV